MLNSVAKYLWGASADNEQGYTDEKTLEQTHAMTGEHLVTQQDDDWVVVGTADKENDTQPGIHHHHNHSQHHHPPHHHHLHQIHQSPAFGANDSLLSQNLGATDIELLDDAASLAHGMVGNHDYGRPDTDRYRPEVGVTCDSSQAPLQDCRLTNIDMDSNYSSDTESGLDSGVRPSSPESVFSACSGRSHATYRPSCAGSEPWVMAPPPCFTGSQVDQLSPIASSPLENLLIEHPSMSVYLSVPASSLPLSHPFHSTHLTGEVHSESGQSAEENERRLVEEEREQQGGRVGAVNDDNQSPTDHGFIQGRNRPAQPVPHGLQATSEQVLQQQFAAQRLQQNKAHKSISKQKCQRQNKVLHFNCSSKRTNNRNKRIRPAGTKCARTCQRV